MTGWAIETLVATTALMVLVLAIRAPVRRAFGPNMAYALWLLPVLRMALPPLPGQWQLSRVLAPFTQGVEAAPMVAGGILNPATLPPALADGAVVQGAISLGGRQAEFAVVPPTVVADGPDLVTALFVLWAAGTLAFLGFHLIAHSRFCSRLLMRARVDRTVAQGRVRVIETDATHGPLAFGIWRKYVAFPRDFSERYDDVERDLALAHELGHHVRGDLIANWVALVMLALHWFNPIAWRAFRAFRADQEMACDALVLAGRPQALRHAYGRAIVKSAHGGAVSAACHLHTINELKGRLRMLSKTRKISPARIGIGMAGVSALTLGALAITASGSQAAEGVRTHVETTVGVSLDSQDVPAAPEAPARPARVQDVPAVPEVPSRRALGSGGQHQSYEIQREVRDGKEHRRVSYSITRPDGVVERRTLQDPEIVERKCGRGSELVMPETDRDGGVKRLTICTDRIEATATAAQARAEKATARAAAAQARAASAAAEAEVTAASAGKYQRIGLESALTGLHSARKVIEGIPDMPKEERAKALAEIDDGIAEVRRELASLD